MDGVLVDSERAYIDSLYTFLKNNHAQLKKEELYKLVGCPNDTDNQLIAEKLNMNIEKAKKMKDEYFDTHPIIYSEILKEKCSETLEYLKNKKIRMALASSSSKEMIQRALNECQIASYFEMVVSGDEFVESKPNPEIYEYTVKKLNLKKQQILVVEDSTYGICAAKRANLKVCAMKDQLFHFDLHEADYIVSCFDELIQVLKGEILC